MIKVLMKHKRFFGKYLIVLTVSNITTNFRSPEINAYYFRTCFVDVENKMFSPIAKLDPLDK